MVSYLWSSNTSQLSPFLMTFRTNVPYLMGWQKKTRPKDGRFVYDGQIGRLLEVVLRRSLFGRGPRSCGFIAHKVILCPKEETAELSLKKRPRPLNEGTLCRWELLIQWKNRADCALIWCWWSLSSLPRVGWSHMASQTVTLIHCSPLASSICRVKVY